MSSPTPPQKRALADMDPSELSKFLEQAVQPSLTDFKLPPMPRIETPPMVRLAAQQLKAAELMYQRIGQQIADFEAKLDPSEEIGARFVAAPGEGVIHIESLGYWGSDLLIFNGTNADGRPVQVLQHVSQISITLTALPAKGPEPRRIGFLSDQCED